MSKRRILFLLELMLVICFSGCGSKKETGGEKVTKGSDLSEFVKVDELHSTDAKFYKGKVVTGVDGYLTLLSADGKIEKKYDGIKVNWVDTIEEENILVYGNFEHETGIVKFDDNQEVISNEIIMQSQNLQIDPTISLIDGVYYMTVTEIIGNVNRANEDEENGEYILHFYSSEDLKNWTFISDITDDRHNIEDVDIINDGNDIYAVYEKEELDKGNSAIILKKSEDKGQTWSGEIELLPAEADQEPAVFCKKGNEFVLYYSSDILNKGESYMGAAIYYAIYDSEFNIIKKNQAVASETPKGILLYGILKADGYSYMLYAQDYLTTNDLIIERVDNSLLSE